MTKVAEAFNKTQGLWTGEEATLSRKFAVRFNNYTRGTIPVVERYAFNNDGNTPRVYPFVPLLLQRLRVRRRHRFESRFRLP